MFLVSIIAVGLSQLVKPAYAQAPTTPVQQAQSVLQGYKDACDKCVNTIEKWSSTISQKCQRDYNSIVINSVEMMGLQYMAIADAVGHPQAYLLSNHAKDTLNCANLTAWSQGIVDYADAIDKMQRGGTTLN
ncbi:hypothetical protein L0B53_18625 (plasmid) [Vibrio sp. SS-MA-C1-2]|uniref:hypothetical protein n=1 Tax=Vibrio sp. SS-MA-C1-2 TaxID=2908646 RepID=UPI001F42ACA5|nr:hypothetical protein [Vibrio sp. SS-MA-C1-2]UJF20337.1 hypothetical protein L0B53_18625 [Vibrio sp. SS-MA-C1-2]